MAKAAEQNCIQLGKHYVIVHSHMRYIIRSTGFIGFIFFAALTFGCGNSTAFTGGEGDVDRALVYPETTVARPKILAFGDSLTAGFGLTEMESYPYLLQEKLKQEGFNYEVVNAGVSGDTTLGGLERIDWALEQDGLEVIILELGANDLMRGVPAERIAANLDKIIAKAKAKNIKVLLCGMLAPPTMGANYQRAFTNTFPDLAAKHKVAYLPFLLDGVALKKELNQADGIHPNPQGTRIMMENIYRELQPLLVKQ